MMTATKAVALHTKAQQLTERATILMRHNVDPQVIVDTCLTPVAEIESRFQKESEKS